MKKKNIRWAFVCFCLGLSSLAFGQSTDGFQIRWFDQPNPDPVRQAVDVMQSTNRRLLDALQALHQAQLERGGYTCAVHCAIFKEGVPLELGDVTGSISADRASALEYVLGVCFQQRGAPYVLSRAKRWVAPTEENACRYHPPVHAEADGPRDATSRGTPADAPATIVSATAVRPAL